MSSITYNEKLTKLATEFGISNEKYLEMIKREIVIEGAVLWIIIGFSLTVLVFASYLAIKANLSEEITIFDRLEDLFIPLLGVSFIVSVILFIATNLYTIPLNKTFNTDYVVTKEIHEKYEEYFKIEETEEENNQ